jgi:cytochrome c
MKFLRMPVFLLITLTLILSFAFAAGNVEKGKAMFNDPKLGTNGITCNNCHPGGKGLEKAGDKNKTQWKTPGGVTNSLQDAVNICITMALKGKALDNDSQAMQDIVAYITSLGDKASMKKQAPGY